MSHFVQVLQQSEVCGEEDVCSAFGHQIAGMVNGVPIHLIVEPDCQFLPWTVGCNRASALSAHKVKGVAGQLKNHATGMIRATVCVKTCHCMRSNSDIVRMLCRYGNLEVDVP